MTPPRSVEEWAKICYHPSNMQDVGLCLNCARAYAAEQVAAQPLDFTGHDHPEANGQRPTPGAFEWTFSFTLEDGRTLKVRVGEKGFRAFEGMFLKNRDADYQERDALKVQVAQARAEEREACAKLIPTTWLDPLLTGEGGVLEGYGPWNAKQIERLLQAIAAAIRARRDEG